MDIAVEHQGAQALVALADEINAEHRGFELAVRTAVQDVWHGAGWPYRLTPNEFVKHARELTDVIPRAADLTAERLAEVLAKFGVAMRAGDSRSRARSGGTTSRTSTTRVSSGCRRRRTRSARCSILRITVARRLRRCSREVSLPTRFRTL